MKVGKGNRRVDLNDFVESITNPNDTYAEIAIVRSFNGQSHYEFPAVNGKKVDIYIECQIVPTGEEITARLCGIGQSGASGIFRIPPPGTEVVVVFPHGEFDGLPYIVGISPTTDPAGQGVPDELDGDTLVVANDNATIVVSHNGDITINAKAGNVIINASQQVQLNGTDQFIALATDVKANLDAISSAFNAHFHAVSGTATGAPDGYSYTSTDVASSKVKAGK